MLGRSIADPPPSTRFPAESTIINSENSNGLLLYILVNVKRNQWFVVPGFANANVPAFTCTSSSATSRCSMRVPPPTLVTPEAASVAAVPSSNKFAFASVPTAKRKLPPFTNEYAPLSSAIAPTSSMQPSTTTVAPALVASEPNFTTVPAASGLTSNVPAVWERVGIGPRFTVSVELAPVFFTITLP